MNLPGKHTRKELATLAARYTGPNPTGPVKFDRTPGRTRSGRRYGLPYLSDSDYGSDYVSDLDSELDSDPDSVPDSPTSSASPTSQEVPPTDPRALEPLPAFFSCPHPRSFSRALYRAQAAQRIRAIIARHSTEHDTALGSLE